MSRADPAVFVVSLASFGLSATPAAIGVARRLRPDIVFAVAATLTAAGAALAAARVSGAASWLHTQDFEVDSGRSTMWLSDCNNDGGPGRNRTGVHGFAVRCVTTPPPGHPGVDANHVGGGGDSIQERSRACNQQIALRL